MTKPEDLEKTVERAWSQYAKALDAYRAASLDVVARWTGDGWGPEEQTTEAIEKAMNVAASAAGEGVGLTRRFLQQASRLDLADEPGDNERTEDERTEDERTDEVRAPEHAKGAEVAPPWVVLRNSARIGVVGWDLGQRFYVNLWNSSGRVLGPNEFAVDANDNAYEFVGRNLVGPDDKPADAYAFADFTPPEISATDAGREVEVSIYLLDGVDTAPEGTYRVDVVNKITERIVIEGFPVEYPTPPPD